VPSAEDILFIAQDDVWTESVWYSGHYFAPGTSPGLVATMRIIRRNRIARRKLTSVLLRPQIPHDLGSNTGRRGGKPEINHMSYGPNIKYITQNMTKNCKGTFEATGVI
jgi:hypothetical protein